MTTAPKPPKPLRMNQKAVLIPPAQYQIWYDQAVLTSGLSELDRAVLDAVVTYYQLLEQRGHALVPSIEMMARATGTRSIDITGAIRNLVGLALLAVKPGAGARRNEYLLCLPRRVVAVMASAAADDDVPPF
jgi:hypothetical protein